MLRPSSPLKPYITSGLDTYGYDLAYMSSFNVILKVPDRLRTTLQAKL